QRGHLTGVRADVEQRGQVTPRDHPATAASKDAGGAQCHRHDVPASAALCPCDRQVVDRLAPDDLVEQGPGEELTGPQLEAAQVDGATVQPHTRGDDLVGAVAVDEDAAPLHQGDEAKD